MRTYKYIGWFVASMVLLEFSTYASNDMILPAMPGIISIFGGGLHHIQLSMSLYILGCAVFQLFIVVLADYYGQRKTLLFGALYFTITTLIIISSWSMASFLSYRFIAGVSMSFSSLGYSIIHNFYNDKQAARVTSLMQNFTIISPVVGPMIGVFILRTLSWHYIFIFSALLGIISFLGIKISLPKEIKPRAKLKLSKMFRDYFKLLRNKHYLIGVFACLFMTLPYLIWIAFSTTVIKEHLRLPDNEYIILQLIALGGTLFSTIIIHLFAGKMSFVRLMILGVSLSVLGLCSSFFAPENIYLMAFGMLVYGLGAGLFNTLSVRIIGTIKFLNPNMLFTFFTFTQLAGFFVGISGMEFLFASRDYDVKSFALSETISLGFILIFPIYFIYLNKNRTWN